MKIAKTIKSLCTPALIYFSISIVALLMMVIQNYGSHDRYCLGSFSCPSNNISLIFIAKVIYIIFWTFILNLICTSGFSSISWFLVLFPFLFMFVALGIMILQGQHIESMCGIKKQEDQIESMSGMRTQTEPMSGMRKQTESMGGIRNHLMD
jgi:hypothetical protein